MYILTKMFRFEASHQLPYHDGKCARLHGHSWVGAVICEGPVLQLGGSEDGMLLDYAAISAALAPLLADVLDHYHLNDTMQLVSPTSENVARWIFVTLARHEVLRPYLRAVVIEETCTSRCEYRP